MKPFPRIAGAVLVCAYALTSAAGGSWVVCSGGDGHNRVETKGSPCCAGAPGRTTKPCGSLESKGTASWRSPPPARGCGACSDTPLATAASVRSEPLKLPTKSVTAGALPAIPSGGFPGAASCLALSGKTLRGTSPSGGTLTRLRTVVLRC